MIGIIIGSPVYHDRTVDEGKLQQHFISSNIGFIRPKTDINSTNYSDSSLWIHRYGLILEDVREAKNRSKHRSHCHLALCFLPEASVTQPMLLTASPPSRCDRVTFLFPPHTVLLRSLHLCLFTILPASPSIWCEERGSQLLLSCRPPASDSNTNRPPSHSLL